MTKYLTEALQNTNNMYATLIVVSLSMLVTLTLGPTTLALLATGFWFLFGLVTIAHMIHDKMGSARDLVFPTCYTVLAIVITAWAGNVEFTGWTSTVIITLAAGVITALMMLGYQTILVMMDNLPVHKPDKQMVRAFAINPVYKDMSIPVTNCKGEVFPNDYR